MTGMVNEFGVGQMEFEILEEQLYGDFSRELELGGQRPKLAVWIWSSFVKA